MANGAIGSRFVTSTKAQILGRSAGFGRARVGHTNTAPANTMSRLPSMPNTSTWAPRPASTATSASPAWAAVTRRPPAALPVAIVVTGQQHDQPTEQAEHGQRADPASGRRIHLHDDPLARAQPQSKIDARFAHSKRLRR